MEDALREGVRILDGVMPVEIIVDDRGSATALKFAKCTLEEGVPTPVEGSEFEVECDLIVSAIGQGGDLQGIEEMGNDRNLMNADKFFQHPDRPGHFVAGDIIQPPSRSASSTSCSVAVISAFSNSEVKVTSAPWRDAA